MYNIYHSQHAGEDFVCVHTLKDIYNDSRWYELIGQVENLESAIEVCKKYIKRDEFDIWFIG